MSGLRTWVLVLVSVLAGALRVDAALSVVVADNKLQIAGDSGPNQITVRTIATNSGRLEVLDGSVSVGTFARSTFSRIVINGNDGNDTITLSGPFPILEPATINGGDGNDTLRGGAGADSINGGAGNDRIIWNPGDGFDIVSGDDDFDRLEVIGSSGADTITVERNFSDPRFTVRVDSIEMDVGAIEVVAVSAGEGDDQLAASGNLRSFVSLIFDGGPGDDLLLGSNGSDILVGGPGRDRLRGGPGNDQIFAGSENDIIFSGQDEESDVIEGEDGIDTLSFLGSLSSESIVITPNGGRVILTDNPGSQVLDIHDVEKISVNASGGNDVISAEDGLLSAGVTQLVLAGGDGDDAISGSDTPDQLQGGPGTNVLLGRGGDDEMFWSPFDGNDEFRGGDGYDRVIYSSEVTDAADVLLVTSTTVDGLRFTIQRDGVALLRAAAEGLDIHTQLGADRITIDGEFALVDITIDGGKGPDVISTTALSTITVTGNEDIDQLLFNALDSPVSVTPSSIAVAGVTRVRYSDIEDVRFSRVVGSLPTVAIASPTADPSMTSTKTFLALAGTAADAEGLESLTVTSDRRGSIAATGTAAWVARDIPLAAGANLLTATARDTNGNEVSDTLMVFADDYTYTMAEGATGSFFDTDILIANPNTVEAPVSITYLRGDGVTVPQSLTLKPMSRTTIRVDEIPGLEFAEVSATVTSLATLPLIVERTMRWDATGYGAHTEKATDGPATTWLFAEGSQGFFDTYILLANPQPTENTATVTFLVEGGAPVVKTFTLAPTSRRTIQANAIPEIRFRSFGIAVTFTMPGAAERAMYFGTPLFNAGHESAGVNEASTHWFLAEGATGSFFTTFVLLANPGAADAVATLTFLPESGAPVTRTKTVPAGGRITLNIAGQDPSLAASAVATAVESTQPILVERAQYWPFSPDQWYEAHNSFGSTSVARKWGLAEGRVGGPEHYQTFILLANADPAEAAGVRITFLRVDGTTVVRTFTVPPAKRFTVLAHEIPELANASFGALIEVTSGPGIFVERALYSNSQGVLFAAGTNALATRLP